MSRRSRPWVVATITVLFATTLALTDSVPAATAAPGDPIIPTTPSCVIQLVSGDPVTAPPAPTCYDPSGSDLDELLAPLHYDASGKQVIYRSESWSPYKWDQPNSTRGSGQVNVLAAFFDPSLGGYVDSFKWTLTFSTGVTAQPSANSYWVVVGDCVFGGATPVRPTTAYFRNEVGADARYVGFVTASTGTNESVSATRVLEGATVGLPLIVDSSQPGLSADLERDRTYSLSYWLEDRNSVVGSGAGTGRTGAELKVVVPACKRQGDGPGVGTSVKPQAKIVVLKRGPVFNVVKVVLGSRKATAPTKYQVIRDPSRGPTLRKTYDTKYKVVKYYKIRKGTVVKVRFKTVLAKRRI